MTKPILVTMGDPAGIGGEILLQAVLSGNLDLAGHPLVVVDDPDRLQRVTDALSLQINIEAIKSLGELPAASDASTIHVWPLPMKVPAELGKPSIAHADAIIESINIATAAVIEGHAAALVTNPIAKDVLLQSGFRYPGHTEYLGHLAQVAGFETERAVMMLAGPSLKTVPITVHIPLANVPLILRSGLIETTARIVHNDLRDMFGIQSPRLAISGLNPHAGENGLMGQEEEREIEPAIEALKKDGVNVTGPHPADTLFEASKRESYDVALCMYHDQALIPVKTLDMDNTVNVTLGLPFIRTSPDHGTAFDIAGKGIARPQSLIAAINMAADIAVKRTAHAA
ncbi:MAG: 4-hydroxythreonine-4-phosphate dehydrogenase PdxA [Alphaproteobacteria bacterium]|nr:4-hydroxythreonine-4-phosphate dehydrogenase PdxA [Alphaproteobacteria bacterium SS10]